MTFDNLPDIVTPKQVADYFQISEMTVKRALKSGKLIGFRVNNAWRIQKKQLSNWVIPNVVSTSE